MKCDELTAYKGDVTIPVYGTIADAEVYLKDEADKYINLLKDKANYNEYAYKHKSEELADTCRFYEDEIRHNKYKRCLAMAMWCSAELGMLVSTWESKIKYYKRWQKRWLELAEKFKEVK